MSLQQKLDAKKKDFESSVPKDALAIMHRATEDLRNSGISERVLGVGDVAPDFTLNNADEKPIHQKEILSRGPVVLGFYRGRW
jgi:hypothetical protein